MFTELLSTTMELEVETSQSRTIDYSHKLLMEAHAQEAKPLV